MGPPNLDGTGRQSQIGPPLPTESRIATLAVWYGSIHSEYIVQLPLARCLIGGL